jgi:hypothetical protein
VGGPFENLDDDGVRPLMVAEIESDIVAGKLYYSSYLSVIGRIAWPGILLEAAKAGDEATCANGLKAGRNLKAHIEQQHGGTMRSRKVPHNAAENFTGTEFNVYYMRAVARLALNQGLEVQVYRRTQVSKPRRESELLVGRVLNPRVVLEDLQNRIDGQSRIGLAEPNSGITLRIVPAAANDR